MKNGATLLTLGKRGRSCDGTKLDNTAHFSDPGEINSISKKYCRLRILLPVNLQLHNVTYCPELVLQIRV
jgi:hypothetical protein